MPQRLYVIYVPGVGDSRPDLQRKLVKTWNLWGVDAELFQINWAENIAWDVKLSRLLNRIDELLSSNRKVALVGASAGGSAVVNAYAARKNDISGIVTICGKLKNSSDIGPKYYNTNPPLVDSVAGSEKALPSLTNQDKNRILTRRALFDEVVTTKSDSMVVGANNQISPTAIHSLTIGFQLIFGAPSFLRFLKHQNR